MARKRAGGVALLTALFFVLVCFFLVTVMTATAQRELILTRHSAEETRRSYAAFGAVNEAIALLSEGESWEEHPRETPLRFTQGDLELEAWFGEDAEHPELLHVFALASSGQRRGILRERVIRKSPAPRGVVYTLNWQGGMEEMPSVLFRPTDGTEWELIPNPPGGRRLASIEAGVDDLYAMTVQLDALTELLADEAMAELRLRGGNWEIVFSGLLWKYEGVNFIWNAPGVERGISRYDSVSQKWTELMRLPRSEMAGRLSAHEKGLFIPVATRDEGGKLYRYDSATGEKWVIPPPPRAVYGPEGTLVEGDRGGIMAVEQEGTGPLYASCSYANGSAIYRRGQDDTWERLPPVPRSYYGEDGRVVTQPGAAEIVTLGGLTPEGEPVAVFRGGLEQYYADGGHLGYGAEMTGRDGLFVFREGAWQLIEPPREGSYDEQGRYVEEPGYEPRYQDLSLDSDGRIATFSARSDGADVLRVLENGGWSVLPPVPRKYYDREGRLHEEEGFHRNQMEVRGGGLLKSGGLPGYSPISTY